jgi:hypothetical protein
MLGLLLGGCAEAPDDADAAVTLVDEESAVSADRDAGGAGRRHGCLL